jgi:hypothetical protein
MVMASATENVDLGPAGPQPGADLRHPLDRRWLHYAFRSADGRLSLIANLSVLGASRTGDSDSQEMSILLVHDEKGWAASQFNATVTGMPWSAFRVPHPGPPLRIAASGGTPALALDLVRTGRPCTSQCAPFADEEYLRWQSEPGILARGSLTGPAGEHRDVTLLGYHERVRGRWAWPHLGGWVFGFANAEGEPGEAPPWAVVFTLIQPPVPADAATASVMVWRRGRLLRHFPRRVLDVTVSGLLPRDRVVTSPPLAGTLGTSPTAQVPARLVIGARTAADHLTIDVSSSTACRIVNPNELGRQGFSVHEVLGPGRIHGRVAGIDLDFTAPAVVEFAGGADVD